MEIHYTINYGGFIGADESYTVYVDEDATEAEIELAIVEDYENRVLENCSWERDE
jgi:hypothetical protein